MRVLFVLGSMSGGGSELQVLEILRHLDRSRFAPILYLAHRIGERLPDVPSDVPIISFWETFRGTFGSKLHYLLGTTHWARWMHLARVMRSRQIDLVYDRTYLASVDAAGACWLRPTSRVACISFNPRSEVEQHSQNHPKLNRKLGSWAFQSASLVLANSEIVRQQAIDYFQLDPNRVQTVFNLVDVSRIERQAIEGEPRSKDEPFLIVTAGRLDRAKGQRCLLEAVDELIHRRRRALKVVLLGQGDLERDLRDFVDGHQLTGEVTFAGFVSNPWSRFSRADLFVLPSLYEGLPNALLEAIVCGTPVIATDCPSGIREILKDGQLGGLVRMNDPLALADAIEDCMNHPLEWKSRAVAAKASIIERFSLEVGLRKLEQIFAETASVDGIRTDRMIGKFMRNRSGEFDWVIVVLRTANDAFVRCTHHTPLALSTASKAAEHRAYSREAFYPAGRLHADSFANPH